MPSAHVPVRSSILDPDALRKMVLPAYGLPALTTCRLISRAVNDVYQVDARSDRFFLRISPHGWRSETELEAEIALIGDLRQRQVRVAVALPRQDGRFLTALAAPEGARYTVLFARAEGDDIREITLRQAAAYGRRAAAMHLAADAAPRQYARPTLDEALLLTEPRNESHTTWLNCPVAQESLASSMVICTPRMSALTPKGSQRCSISTSLDMVGEPMT
jgi:Ser/Thr protein kinase RdoA (MazF antagonist)